MRVGLRANDPQTLAQLRDQLPPGWKPARSPVVERLYSLLAGGAGARSNVRRFNLLYGDGAQLARSLDLNGVLEIFASDVQLYVAEAARRRIFVHAGAVGWRGRAILIPGRSHSGKSSLVAELVRAGAEYYSDEYAVLDERGRVHPYPKPLSLRLNDGDQQISATAETLGGRSGVKPLRVGLAIVSEYKAGAKWRPRQLSTGLGVLSLLANTVAARRRPADALATLQQAVADAPVLKGTRGEAQEAAASILRSMEV